MRLRITQVLALLCLSAGAAFGQTSFTLSSTPNPSNIGQSVTLTAGPVSSFVTVTFYDGGSANGTVLGSASSGNNINVSVSIQFTFTTAGTHQLIACRPGDGAPICTGIDNQVVNAPIIPTTLTFTSSPNPSTPCQSVTLTATVMPASGTLISGSVTFFSDGTALGGNVPLTNGSASFTVTSFTAGNHLLQARYNPDPAYGGSSASLSQSVSSSATVTLGSAPNPSNFNQAVAITAIVSPVPCTGVTQPTPTGTVTFFDGSSQIGQANLASGTATFSTSTLSVGTHSLDARYNGDSNYPAVNSNAVTQTVNPGTKTNTTTSLSASPNPATSGQAVTLSAGVSPSGATGQVQFLDGGSLLGTFTLSNGAASFTTSTLSTGTHSLSAVYLGDTNFNTSTSNTVSETVNPAGKTNTTTSLSASPNPVTSGQPVTLTAGVAPSGATGQVQFIDGGSLLGTVTLANGAASLTTSALSTGTHSLSAVYLGDANFNTSTSNTVTETVNPPGKTNTTTSLSASPNPGTSGQPVTLTASVAPSGATGQVQFIDGGSLLGTGTLSNGAASFTTSTLSTGTHSLSAVYLGDANFNTSTSNNVSETVNPPAKTNTTTSLSASPNPVTSGQPLSLVATVSPAGATGQVQFSDSGSPLGVVTLSNGNASFTTSTLSNGNHSLTATYLGDANFNTSTSPAVNEVVNPPTNQPTSTSLSVTPLSANPGQAVLMSAVVTPGTATGTVTFTDNGSTLATVQLSTGTASFQTTSLTVGTHTIVAAYNGSSTFSPSSSLGVTVVINGTPTQTTLTVSPTASTFGQTVVLNAAVTPTGGGGPATGTITFSDGTNSLGTAPLTGGTASFSISTLSVGAHSLVASYSGSTTFGASSSSPVPLQVGKATTTTVFSVSPTSSASGQAVTLTAKVSPTTGSGVLSGTVTFLDGTVAIGAPVTVANGSASTTTSSLSNGSHSLTAVYSGDANFLTSTSPAVTESVGLTPTTTTLSVTPASSNSGQAVTLTAAVAPAGPTGSVTFLDGTTTLGSQALASGVATFTTSTLSAGTHSLSAVYGGDTKFATSTSATVTETVTGKTNTTTALSASPNPGVSGQPVALKATVTPATATGTVTFLDGTTTLGTGSLTGGTTTFTTSSLSTGSHTLTAAYAGDANNNASTSTPVTEVIGPSGTPLSNIAPSGALPSAIVGVPYTLTFTATGGTGALTWTLVSGSVPGLTLSPAGVLSGTPTTAGTTTLGVRVTDSTGVAIGAGPTLTVLAAPTVSISVTQPTLNTDQPAPTVTPGQASSAALVATFKLTFTPNAAGLPTPFTNTGVQFAGGGTTSPNITIPPNSTAPVALPAVQLGSVAGTITVTLASLTVGGQSVPLTNPPSTNITVPRLVPIIVPGSVKITSITSSGFSVVLDATSTPRDLTSASLTFTATSGDQLNGTTATVSLSTAANTTWFPSTAGVSNGGAFSVTMPFAYSGDTTAIGTVSVTLTNSVGTSTAVSGGH